MNPAHRTKTSAFVGGALLTVALLAAGAWALAQPSTIAAREPAAAPSFDPALVARGARLAALGQCSSCHTADSAAPYAGGLALATPIGTVYSTNITPERDTGIGGWSEQAFTRAMREGISLDGHHLYPAFPYDHYTHLSDADIHAIYAFVMTRDPLHAPPHANRIRFPFAFRPFLASWNMLFLDKRPLQPDPARGAEWNRGAYLAQALGHCASCHSPRTALGAEDQRQYLGGGEAEGWHAPALNAASPSPLPWTVDQLDQYLRTGLAPEHAIAGGPMQDVVAGLSRADPQDVRAIATYIATLMGTPPAERQARARAALAGQARPAAPVPAGDADMDQRQLAIGASVYAGACARCHDAGRQLSSGGALQLGAAIALYEPNPHSLIRIVNDGIAPLPGQPGREMPGFASILSDQQLTALAAYLRHDVANAAPWPDLAASVQKGRSPP